MNLVLLAKNCCKQTFISTPYKIITRFKGNRDNCLFPVKQICKPKILEKNVDEKKKKKKPFISMWENPECCVVTCELPSRSDSLYYKVSDKLKRKYKTTWNECIPSKKPVVKCCFEELDYPPIERRPRKKPCPTTGLTCQKDDLQCPRLKLDYCRPVRNPPKCEKVRPPAGARQCTPYPAYSECLQPSIKPKRKVECDCLNRILLCVVKQYLKKGLVTINQRRKK